MNIKPVIRVSVTGGAYTYGVIESYALGLATVRLATGGARLTSIPITSFVRAGLEVIIDYTNDVPSVRRADMPASRRGSRSLRTANVVPQSFNITNTWIPEP